MTVWTGDMETVVEICGEDIAQEMHETLPGLRLYVPRVPREKGPIQALSAGTISTLVKHFAGNHIYIQSRRRAFEDTYREIEDLVDEGLTTGQIALRLGITQAYVFQVRAKAGAPKIANKPDRRQLPLFEE